VRRWRPVVVALVVVLGVLVLAGVWLVVRSKQAADALARARDGVTSVRDALADGDPQTAQQRLVVVQEDAARAASATSDPVFALAAAVPYLGNTPEAVRTVSATADTLAQDVLGPLVDAGTALSPESLRLGARKVNVAAMQESLPLLQSASQGLADAQAPLDGLDLQGTPSQVSDAVATLETQLADLDEQLSSVTDAMRVLPPMLGADGPRRYLLAIQSNNEARGTGGFLGSYGVLRLDDGEISIERLAPRSFLDRQVYDTLPVDFGPDYAAFYGDQPGSWSSANLSPHYPYAAQLWLKMWQDRFGEKLDGVITTDPVATSYLLKATGPTVLPDGRTVTGQNFVELTESTVYSLIEDDRARDAYLQVIARATLQHVLRFVGNPKELLDALARASGERRLLVYSVHPEEEKELAGMAVGGTLPEGPGPVAGVAVINASGNKADYYIGQDLRYELLGCDGATQRTRITVTLTNSIPPGADLPTYVIGRVDLATPGEPVPTRGGDTRDYLQVYTAQGAELAGATLDGQPVDVERGTERGRPVYRADVTTPAGGSATLTLDLVEPAADGPARTWTTPLVKPATVAADSFECEAQN
jgi:Protein of unknown function (DUF4012)